MRVFSGACVATLPSYRVEDVILFFGSVDLAASAAANSVIVVEVSTQQLRELLLLHVYHLLRRCML